MHTSTSTLYLPVYPLESVSNNEIKKLIIEDSEGIEESSIDLDKIRTAKDDERNHLWAKVVGDNVDQISHYKISLTRGESLFLQFRMKNVTSYDGKFLARAIRYRKVKIFLVNDPFDERILSASRKVCKGQNNIFVLTDELPDLSERMRSFHAMLPQIKDIDANKLIIFLAKKGFYLKDGFVRCNGCEYRKNIMEFVEMVSGPSEEYQASSASFLQPLFDNNPLFEHEDHSCYLARTDNKTFFTISDDSAAETQQREQGHHIVFEHRGLQYFNGYCRPTSQFSFKKDSWFSRLTSIDFDNRDYDRFLHHGYPSFFFTTTVPKSDMLSQDDLIYEASEIKSELDQLRQKNNNLQDLLKQFSDRNPGLARKLGLPAVHGLLSPEIGLLYSRIISKFEDKWVKQLPCVDKPGLRQLLEQLMTLIDHCGGDVAEKGLRCLGILADGSDSESTYDYFSSLPEFSELSQIRTLWIELETTYENIINKKIISPLRHIFTPQELSDPMLSKIFGFNTHQLKLTEPEAFTPVVRQRAVVQP